LNKQVTPYNNKNQVLNRETDDYTRQKTNNVIEETKEDIKNLSANSFKYESSIYQNADESKLTKLVETQFGGREYEEIKPILFTEEKSCQTEYTSVDIDELQHKLEELEIEKAEWLEKLSRARERKAKAHSVRIRPFVSSVGKKNHNDFNSMLLGMQEELYEYPFKS